jgi:hypothetical protein
MKKGAASHALQGWLGFRSFRMRFVLKVWRTFRGIRRYVFKQSYAVAAESQKVPLEIFSNPTILSDRGRRGRLNMLNLGSDDLRQ